MVRLLVKKDVPDVLTELVELVFGVGHRGGLPGEAP